MKGKTRDSLPGLLRIRDYDAHYEHGKSRSVRKKSYSCRPIKCGPKKRRIISLRNGEKIWGAWQSLLDVIEGFEAPRQGYLTTNGRTDGEPLTYTDLVKETDYSRATLVAMIELMVSPGLRFLEFAEPGRNRDGDGTEPGRDEDGAGTPHKVKESREGKRRVVLTRSPSPVGTQSISDHEPLFADDPGIAIYQSIASKHAPEKIQQSHIKIPCDPYSLAFWQCVVSSWCAASGGRGNFSPQNVQGMMEWFKAGSIPGQVAHVTKPAMDRLPADRQAAAYCTPNDYAQKIHVLADVGLDEARVFEEIGVYRFEHLWRRPPEGEWQYQGWSPSPPTAKGQDETEDETA